VSPYKCNKEYIFKKTIKGVFEALEISVCIVQQNICFDGKTIYKIAENRESVCAFLPSAPSYDQTWKLIKNGKNRSLSDIYF
jgi:hypothetical protein